MGQKMGEASIQDLLDLKRGHLASPRLEHRDCGGQVVYSFVRDRVGCTVCGEGWQHASLQAERQQVATPWQPPVDLIR